MSHVVTSLLLPVDTQRLSFAGYITLAEHSFYIKITLPEDKNIQNVRIDCDQKLHNLLKDDKELIKKKLSFCQDLSSVLEELKLILNPILSVHAPPTLPPPTFYNQLITEFEEIGWEKLSFTDATNLQNLEITVKDSGHRRHTLSIHIPNKYPNDVPLCNAVLPIPFQPTWSSSHSLNTLVKQFEESLASYQLFWDTLDELDSNTWVLEPNSPSFSSNYRRIVIGTYLSIQIKIDPLRPWSFPEYILLGPTHEVVPLKERLYSHGKLWNEKCSVLTNLQTILCLEFPSPVTTKREDYLMECGICYSHKHLETERTPDVTCDNKHCAQVYHHSCLHEWLTSLTTTRKSFNKLFGECIYCNQGINISFNG